MAISIQTREVGLLPLFQRKQTEKSPSCIPALLILFPSFPPVFAHVEKNRHFLCSLQVNLCKKFFFVESKFLCMYLSICIFFSFSYFLNMLSLYLKEPFKTFEKYHMLGRSMDDILWKLLSSHTHFRLYVKHWQIPFTEKKKVREMNDKRLV